MDTAIRKRVRARGKRTPASAQNVYTEALEQSGRLRARLFLLTTCHVGVPCAGAPQAEGCVRMMRVAAPGWPTGVSGHGAHAGTGLRAPTRRVPLQEGPEKAGPLPISGGRRGHPVRSDHRGHAGGAKGRSRFPRRHQIHPLDLNDVHDCALATDQAKIGFVSKSVGSTGEGRDDRNLPRRGVVMPAPYTARCSSRVAPCTSAACLLS